MNALIAPVDRRRLGNLLLPWVSHRVLLCIWPAFHAEDPALLVDVLEPKVLRADAHR